jgi:hypothetical protein
MDQQIIDQFEMLNKHITDSIKDKDYVRVAALDQARRDILTDLCMMNADAMDNKFFTFIEKCASQNAKLIQIAERDLTQLSSEAGRLAKAQRAYAI